MVKEKENLLEKIVSLCKRRGFVFPGSEIYGGLANSWDLGHLGNELFNNIASLWWKKFVQERDDIVGLRGPVIMNPKVWEASGHLQSFTDPLVECKICHERFRQDKDEELKEHAESHKGKAEWTEPKNFNLLFKTYIGPVEDQQHVAYLRGELAQTMFTDFKAILETTRKRLPFGIAQIGKAFRNEITTGNFIFRTKEFTIAELEYFVKPGTEDEHYKNWDKFILKFLIDDLKLAKNKIRSHVHSKEKLAHYSKGTVDLEYEFPFGWGELTGLASRTDFDLKNHEKLSGQNIKYKDSETGEEFLPYVVEPTCGLERLMLAVLINSYEEVEPRSGDEEAVHEKEVVLRLPKALAPIKVAVLPLSRKEELTKPAYEIYRDLQKHFMCQYDETASIGKRYRRQDEIGTPYCVTYDFDSLNDGEVTVRDRDTMKQERVVIGELAEYLLKKL
ncbi:MAG: glycine--tRNA ligase [Candidatus Yanofskybacteria bacterium]|nr:glycine--tRNA ligase [Candidatus Yanofskybacteria bacterium]